MELQRDNIGNSLAKLQTMLPQPAVRLASSRVTETADNLQSPDENDPILNIGLPSPLILGSGSFTRKLILKVRGFCGLKRTFLRT